MKEKVRICKQLENGNLKVISEKNLTIEMTDELELYVIYEKQQYVVHLQGLDFWYIVLQ